jgi:molybdopterin converting factor subunit 1
MNLQIQLFASIADIIGQSQITLSVPQEEITVAQLLTILIERFPEAEKIIAISFIAKNQAYALPEERLLEGDEIALIPPVSGGQEELVSPSFNLYTLTYLPLSVEDVTKKVIHPLNGAALTFVGTTREYTLGKQTILLEYTAYQPMALAILKQIGDEISDRWPGSLCAISHRLGKVEISEISVVIAVSTPHRQESYETSRYAIERLKQIVPIWKKEIWSDGSEWKGHQQGPWNPTEQGGV